MLRSRARSTLNECCVLWAIAPKTAQSCVQHPAARATGSAFPMGRRALRLPPSGRAAARAALPAVSAGSVGFESPSMVLGARAIRGRQRKDDSSSDLGPKAGLCARTYWQSDAIRRIRRTGRPDEGPSSLSWPSCVQPQAPCGLTPDLGSSASCTAPPWMYRCNAPSTRPGATRNRRRFCLEAVVARGAQFARSAALIVLP
jgi:hypothetical protein